MYKYSEEFGVHLNVKSSLIVPVTHMDDIKEIIKADDYHLYAICKRPSIRFDNNCTTLTHNNLLKTNILLSLDKEDDNQLKFPATFQLPLENSLGPFTFKLVKNKKEIQVYDSHNDLAYHGNAAIVLQETLDKTRHLHFENGEREQACDTDDICQIIGLEVLYIGQSFGNEEESTTDAYDRLKKHEPLQNVLIELFDSPGEDIWLVLLSLKKDIDIYSVKSSSYKITDTKLNQKHKEDIINFKVSPKNLLHAVEALLIGYFRPALNTEFNYDDRLFPYPNKKYKEILDLDCNAFSLLLSTREKIGENENRFVSTRIFSSKNRNYFPMHIIHKPLDKERAYIYEDLVNVTPVIFFNVLKGKSLQRIKNPV
ncbi:hypothetical protein [Bacillus salipaludis]|uniref:Uncharacterized protein n=1 Tax=Bacillus salipaludis TaxID=2547811 RepID=A0AA90TSQ4_9BACI|nr:hypothetical protein [Bacillus salipaludis]MDQ6598080.1 hypothetical protein [Bacillus salipaludis]